MTRQENTEDIQRLSWGSKSIMGKAIERKDKFSTVTEKVLAKSIDVLKWKNGE